MNASAQDFERVGGRLCLDFVNTRGSHFDPDAREYVGDYAGLVTWLRLCEGGLDARQAARLLASARTHPRLAGEVFAKSRELRALLYRILAARANGNAPVRADLETFDREAQAALAERTLTPGEHWRWTWRDDGALELPLRIVLASSVDLLVNDDPARLRQCPAPDGCGWLFYDTSRNATRRWCSMSMCGNGAKSRRFQRRRREAR
ncbi:MAG TPA: CGNR zinc finger domain-containing protein [Rhodanobacteraceae bacterium]|nr:CGNR zinc finger domain-containing protein [Rhodanobacteraceae bacterium]